MSIKHLKNMVAQPRLMPQSYELQRLDGDDVAVEQPT